MTYMRNCPALGVLFALVLPLLAKAVDRTPISVSVCELAANAASYNGKLVRASGIVESDTYYENLIDPECPTTSVSLDITNEVSDHKDVAKLQKPIYRARPLGTHALKITADVIGIFQQGSGHDPRTINVQSVTKLKIKHWDPKRPKPWMHQAGPPPD